MAECQIEVVSAVNISVLEGGEVNLVVHITVLSSVDTIKKGCILISKVYILIKKIKSLIFKLNYKS